MRVIFIFIASRRAGARVVLMSISPLFFLLLLITIDDRHADQEESNYGVGEDILRGRKKTMLREAVYGPHGMTIFFIRTVTSLRDLFIVYDTFIRTSIKCSVDLVN